MQVYLTFKDTDEAVPLASLVDFKRISLAKGERQKVSFSIPYEEFSYYNSKGEKVQHKGKAIVTVSNASPSERSKELGAKMYELEVSVK